ncbi:X-box-binding protein 1 [Phlebotomus argentipes]|uniref:X-box-binding protein 1 n=1 Tax=Phlebotomus argentipes TaxID=94469 RepID=UPI002892F5A3|nr:X-box-binding protein 1 [Phlebotomus argentipes]
MKITKEILLTQRDSLEEFLGRRRKHRLDHLTKEEKIERKKMKNRVAAQTSRDRKKMKMENMELAIQVLTEENEQLQERNGVLEERLRELESRLEVTQSGNVLEKVMALNLLVISAILVVWLRKSAMESLMMIPSRKAKAPQRFHRKTLLVAI